MLDLMNFDKTKPPEDLELFAVMAMMQAVFRPDVADRIVRIYQKIKHKLNDRHYRERWLRILRYAMSSSKYFSKENFIEVTNQMNETEILTISPFARELLAEGEAKGREEGREKLFETLVKILTKRFGDVSPVIREKIHVIHDLDVLGQLTDYALDCQTLNEFVRALKE